MNSTEYKPYVIDTGYLFPPSLADFLGAEDEVHIFREVTEHLDISYLDCDFNGMGQHPYHPLMLLRLLMWGDGEPGSEHSQGRGIVSQRCELHLSGWRTEA